MTTIHREHHDNLQLRQPSVMGLPSWRTSIMALTTFNNHGDLSSRQLSAIIFLTPIPPLLPPPPQFSPSPHNNPAARNRSGRQACSGSTPAGSLNASHHRLPRGKSTTGRGFAKRLRRQQLFACCINECRQFCSGSTPAGSLNVTHCNSLATERGLVKRLRQQAYGESTPAGSLNATHHKLPRGKPTTGRGFAKRPGGYLLASCREGTNPDNSYA
ncbi:hypothetical protein PENVUL_c017G08292 [Penicillium vulpinum]|uniref:Uncharacterized protein n=1 Tax=Penicillium vulpinum TaxID=29845 RepID=A0A1V6RXT2_9EURO|nr:hypothetical protein PENVUL_c017G08292 [Penicillium vulpinum]